MLCKFVSEAVHGQRALSKDLKVGLSREIFLKLWTRIRTRYDPDGEIENSGKSIYEIQIQNVCYNEVIVFDLNYLPVEVTFYIFHNFFMVANSLSPNHCHW